MFEGKYFERLMNKKKSAPVFKPKVMKIPEFKDKFLDEELIQKIRA